MIKIAKELQKRFYDTMKEEEGMGVVEVVLIVLVLVGLALLFKDEIDTIARGIFNSIKTQVKRF